MRRSAGSYKAQLACDGVGDGSHMQRPDGAAGTEAVTSHVEGCWRGRSPGEKTCLGLHTKAKMLRSDDVPGRNERPEGTDGGGMDDEVSARQRPVGPKARDQE